MSTWNLKYIKPKGDFNDWSFDIEIIVDSDDGRGKSRIVRNCKYNETTNSFEEYGTENVFSRYDIFKWMQHEKIPCNNCQGGGCTTCNGYGYYYN